MQDYYEEAPIPPRPARPAEDADAGSLPRQLIRLAALMPGRAADPAGHAVSFYTQAKLMEDYRDQAEWNQDLVAYYPTYRSFSMAQLRGYFGWRTRWRDGTKTWAPLSFIFMHVYELLMCVGAEGPSDALAKLRALYEAYGQDYSALVYYLDLWMPDMAVYYGLEAEASPDLEAMRRHDAAFAVLAADQAQDEDLYAAICALSSHRLDRSVFCRRYPDRARACVCRVWRALDTYYRRRWKKSACQRLVGTVQTRSYPMFYNAVFYDRRRAQDRTVTLNPVRSWTCRAGRWRITTPSLEVGRRSRELGALMQECDRLMREVFGQGKPLKQKLTKPGLSAVIRKAIEEEARAEQEAARARVDLASLDEIRSRADQTRDMLLDGASEEVWPDQAEAQTPASVPDQPQPQAPRREAEPPAPALQAQSAGPADDPLTDLERAFLQALLCGDDALALARDRKVFPGVLADGINEKLYDRFDDTVLETLDDRIRVIEDYQEELQDLYLK